MRDKYVLRSGEVGADPYAWVLAIYFTRSEENSKKGVLTIGGPKRFFENMDEVLKRFFDCDEGTEEERAEERQRDKQRKRLVYDVGSFRFKVFRRGVRQMIHAGIHVVRVRATGRLLR